MRKEFVLGMIFALLLAGNTYAGETVQELARVKVSLDTVGTLVNQGVITKQQGETGYNLYFKEASRIAGKPVTASDLAALKFQVNKENGELTLLQKAAGLVTFTNIVIVLAIVLMIASLGFLFPIWIKLLLTVFALIPVELYEALLYVASAGLMLANLWLHNGMEQYLALFGALLLPCAIGVTKLVHKIETSDPVRFSATLFVVWSAVACTCQNSMVGFIAIGALMSLLGFSAAITPLCYYIGFKDKESVGRATSAAFVILGVYVAAKISGYDTGRFGVFEEGALFLGSFVGYIGLLIASSKWYDNEPTTHTMKQLLTLAAGCAALFFGSVYHIGELLKIGGTFFVLWGLEKTLEIMPKDRETAAYYCLFLSGLVFALGWYLKTHTAVVAPYLLFL